MPIEHIQFRKSKGFFLVMPFKKYNKLYFNNTLVINSDVLVLLVSKTI